MKKYFRKSYKQLILVAFVILFFVLGFDQRLIVKEYTVSNAKIPAAFDGYSIVQISDLHCKRFGNAQKKLITLIEKEKPEIIVLTGDIFDNKRWDYTTIRDFLSGIEKIAPVYAITGNHEYDDESMFQVLLELYSQYGITLLNDGLIRINKQNEQINLYGMYYRNYIYSQADLMEGELGKYNVLLYHDPTQFKRLLDRNFDLIITGHTHGGIIRIPILGGVIGTDLNLFPKYDYGSFIEMGTELIVSSGVGDADIPRFFNRPEIVKITLKKE